MDTKVELGFWSMVSIFWNGFWEAFQDQDFLTALTVIVLIISLAVCYVADCKYNNHQIITTPKTEKGSN